MFFIIFLLSNLFFSSFFIYCFAKKNKNDFLEQSLTIFRNKAFALVILAPSLIFFVLEVENIFAQSIPTIYSVVFFLSIFSFFLFYFASYCLLRAVAILFISYTVLSIRLIVATDLSIIGPFCSLVIYLINIFACTILLKPYLLRDLIKKFQEGSSKVKGFFYGLFFSWQFLAIVLIFAYLA